MLSTLLILIASLAIGAVAWWRGARLVAVLVLVFALLPAWTLVRSLPWWAWLPVAFAAGALLWSRQSRSAGVVARWAARSRRRAGVASTADIVRHASKTAMRKQATTVRPSLDTLTCWQRRRLPAGDYAVQLCRAGAVRVWSSVEDVTVVVGGPRAGKTGFLAGRVIDAPGAALVTSTRTDLYQLCAPHREKRGPVYVFNAVGMAGIPSSITFDPLTGCTDPTTAQERATDLMAAVSRGTGGDREFWDTQGRRVLAALLYAAALGGKRMGDVLGWVADPEGVAKREIPTLLRRAARPEFEKDAGQFLATNERTRTSITSAIMPALGWLTSPAAAAAGEPGEGFDVEELLTSRATVFLLGAEETQAAPLVCALTGHIAREARRLAATRPSGRLDPPLGLFLDEAALISPVPLESWTADMGGRGVTILAAFQSRAQILARWGEHGAATILNNTASVMVFGGTRDKADLEFWSTLAGERDEAITTTDLHGRVASRTTRKVAVLPPAQIANLPAGRVLLIRRGLAPVIGRVEMAWKRADVRAQQRGGPTRVGAWVAWWVACWVVVQRWADEVIEQVLAWLAGRWPARFTETAQRVRAGNDMAWQRTRPTGRVLAVAEVLPEWTPDPVAAGVVGAVNGHGARLRLLDNPDPARGGDEPEVSEDSNPDGGRDGEQDGGSR